MGFRGEGEKEVVGGKGRWRRGSAAEKGGRMRESGRKKGREEEGEWQKKGGKDGRLRGRGQRRRGSHEGGLSVTFTVLIPQYRCTELFTSHCIIA